MTILINIFSGNCDLKVNGADLNTVIEKGVKPVLAKVASYLECKEVRGTINN